MFDSKSLTDVNEAAAHLADERCHVCQRSSKQIRRVFSDTQTIGLKEVFSKTFFSTKQGIL